jgi:hypothetical protein
LSGLLILSSCPLFALSFFPIPNSLVSSSPRRRPSSRPRPRPPPNRLPPLRFSSLWAPVAQPSPKVGPACARRCSLLRQFRCRPLSALSASCSCVEAQFSHFSTVPPLRRALLQRRAASFTALPVRFLHLLQACYLSKPFENPLGVESLASPVHEISRFSTSHLHLL